MTAAKLKNSAVIGTKIQASAISNEKIADAAVTLTKLGGDSVDATKVVDKSLTGKDVAPNSLTGENIAESTLGEVPNATRLAGKTASQFTSSNIYKKESAVEEGETIGDGTQKISEACNPGDVLLSGGPANIAATTTLLESFPSPGSNDSWTVRVNKNGQTDNFSVVVLCAAQG